jgi:hypothetical protein
MDRTSEPRTPVFGPRTIGGHVIGPVVVTRTTGAVVVLRQVLAYPNGIESTSKLHGQEPKMPTIDRDAPFRLHEDRPRFSVGFADGRAARETTTSPLGTEMTGQ